MEVCVGPQRAPVQVWRSVSLDASSFLIYNPPEAANVEFQQDIWLMGEFYNGSHYTVGLHVLL